MGKDHPTNENDLADFVRLSETKADSDNSWSLDVQAHCNASNSYDLSVKNPNKKEESALRDPQTILKEMRALDEEIT